tara:strand:- start:98 stop:892 length:795 start_codon:yes stop_codon:yes gene_type:complete
MKIINSRFNLSFKKKYIYLFIFCYPYLCFSQSIVNTESISKKTDSTFSLITSLDGDFTTGNIELVQLNSSTTLAYKKKKSLIRFFFNYEFISSNKEIISSDYTSQIRYSYELKNSSIYSFLQGQKAISLSLNSRYLFGFGYRQKIISKDQNYLDIAFGPFYENEMYLKNTNNEVYKINYRYSFSTFMNFKVANNLQSNTVFYYQIKSNDFDDFRIYIEPKLIYAIDDIQIYATLRYRYHSSPYIDIRKTDSQLLFGVSYEFNKN